MIASLRGTVLSVTSETAVVEVGGVGMAVRITPACAAELRTGHETMLHTTLIVREDELSLYGFAHAAELHVFDLLRSVTGVGPKSALGVLAALTPEAIARAIAEDDDVPFRKVSGIGPKTAKLIVVSLAGKMAATPVALATPGTPAGLAEAVVAALIGLGWPERAATDAVAQVAADDPGTDGMSGLLRRALAVLGSARSTGARS